MGRIPFGLTTLTKSLLFVTLGAVGIGGGAVLAVVISNVLTFGPIQLASAVAISTEQNLPAATQVGQENPIKFSVRSSQQISNASLYFLLKSPTEQLTDPTIAEVKYKGPGDRNFAVVPLAASNIMSGTLQAALKTGWLIPQGSNNVGEVNVTFKPNAPSVAYYVNVWVDGSLGSSAAPAPAPTETTPASSPTEPTPTPAPTGGGTASFTLGTDRNPNRLTWISGPNADGSVPPAPNSINLWPLVVRAGHTVQITFNGTGGTHIISVYPPTVQCTEGFCPGQLARSGEVPPGGTASLSFSYPTAGATLHLVCDEHPGTMRTTVSVIP